MVTKSLFLIGLWLSRTLMFPSVSTKPTLTLKLHFNRFVAFVVFEVNQQNDCLSYLGGAEPPLINAFIVSYLVTIDLIKIPTGSKIPGNICARLAQGLIATHFATICLRYFNVTHKKVLVGRQVTS